MRIRLQRQSIGAHDGDAGGYRQPFGGAHPHPQRAERPRPQRHRHAGQVAGLGILRRQQLGDGRQQLRRVAAGGTPKPRRQHIARRIAQRSAPMSG